MDKDRPFVLCSDRVLGMEARETAHQIEHHVSELTRLRQRWNQILEEQRLRAESPSE